MNVCMTLVRNLQGEGCNSRIKHPNGFSADARYKAMRSIVQIKESQYDPENILCGPRAIVVSVSNVEDTPGRFTEVRKYDRPLQCELAR